MLTLTMYPARNGDSFLVQLDRMAILIDGGYASSFRSHVLPDLRGLARRGGELSLVIATHIDADHISGLITFFSMNSSAIRPDVIAVRQVWHNSLRSIASSGTESQSLSQGDQDLLKEICHSGLVAEEGIAPLSDEISSLQGSSLASLLDRGAYAWNEGKGLRPIISHTRYDISPSASLTVLGPTIERLKSLRQCWINDLRRLGVSAVIDSRPLFEDAFEFMTSYKSASEHIRPQEIASSGSHARLEDVYVADDSVTNGSSISFILHAGKRKILFLADGWAEDCIQAIAAAGLGRFPILFDAIKVSHHGSLRNTSPELLTVVDSPCYFISTNGDHHGHPDVAVLTAIVDRPAPFHRDIYFNYSTPSSTFLGKYKTTKTSAFTVHEDSTATVHFSQDVA